jgi:ribulose-5-phosphate 4-epimerase/fuculose-1-phosphate aldolase
LPQPFGYADPGEEAARAARRQLADAIAMLERAGIVDHNGHCSVRRDGRSFHINSAASIRSRIRPDDIVAVDLDGNLLEGSSRPPLEFYIHSEIYRRRADVNAIAHTHPKWSTLLTMTGHPFRVVYAQASLLGDVPVLDSPLSVNTKAAGEKLAATLGSGPAALLKAHGAVVVGADMIECFALAAYMEESAERQYLALQIGEPYVFSEEEQRVSREKLRAPSLLKKTWDHYFAKLG